MRCEECGSITRSKLCRYCAERRIKNNLVLYENETSKKSKNSGFKTLWFIVKGFFKLVVLILLLLLLYKVGVTLSKGVSPFESYNTISLFNMDEIVSTFASSLNTDSYDTTLNTQTNRGSLEALIPYLETCIQSADKLYHEYSKNGKIDSMSYEKLKSDVSELSERLETFKGKTHNTQLYYSMDDCTYYLGIFLESLRGNRFELDKKISDIHYYYEDVHYYLTSGK